MDSLEVMKLQEDITICILSRLGDLLARFEDLPAKFAKILSRFLPLLADFARILSARRLVSLLKKTNWHLSMGQSLLYGSTVESVTIFGRLLTIMSK